VGGVGGAAHGVGGAVGGAAGGEAGAPGAAAAAAAAAGACCDCNVSQPPQQHAGGAGHPQRSADLPRDLPRQVHGGPREAMGPGTSQAMGAAQQGAAQQGAAQGMAARQEMGARQQRGPPPHEASAELQRQRQEDIYR